MIEFNEGFTLVEVLVVISIIGTIAIASGNIFYSTLRTNSKTQLNTDLKQRGDYALTVMERMIREAQEINSCSAKEVELVYKDDQTTTFSCNMGSTEIASASANNGVLFRPIDCNNNFNFDCNLPQIRIGFTVNENANDPLPFKKSSLEFSTSVTVRNL